MSIYQLKSSFQNLLQPICDWLAARRVTANQVTVAAMILSLFAGLFIFFKPTIMAPLILLPLVLLIRMALNAIDGMLAREHNMQSNLGAILNELGDVISDVVLFLPLALVPVLNAYLMLAIVIMAILTEMMGVVAIQIGTNRRYDGPMGKSDRAFIFGVLGLLIGCGWLTSVVWCNIILSTVLVLTFLTVLNRAAKALKEAAIAD